MMMHRTAKKIDESRGIFMFLKSYLFFIEPKMQKTCEECGDLNESKQDYEDINRKVCTKAYSETCQTSIMECFSKVVNSY